MKQNKEPKNIPTPLWSINIQQKSQENTIGKERSLYQMLVGRPDSHMQKNETGPLTPCTKITQYGSKT